MASLATTADEYKQGVIAIVAIPSLLLPPIAILSWRTFVMQGRLNEYILGELIPALSNQAGKDLPSWAKAETASTAQARWGNTKVIGSPRFLTERSLTGTIYQTILLFPACSSALLAGIVMMTGSDSIEPTDEGTILTWLILVAGWISIATAIVVFVKWKPPSSVYARHRNDQRE